MLATFVIGLREGLEAALIVGIVAAFLRQRGRTDSLRWVWLGVVVASAICLVFAVGLQVFSASLPQAQQEALETVIGAVALVVVTYMIVWMRRHARNLKGDLELAAGAALVSGTAWALVGMAFLAVLREGFETAVFLLAAFQASGSAIASGIGALLGIVVASAIGYAIYRGGVRLNLARFFRLTGFVLVLVAAGLVATALHTAHEAGWIDIGQQQVLDLSGLIQPGSIQAALLTGLLGFQPRPTAIEALGWLLYVVPMAAYVLWPQRRSPTRAVVACLLLAMTVGCSAGAGSPPASGGSGAPASSTVAVTLTDAGCPPVPPSVAAGPVTFEVTNNGAAGVTELELVRDGKILGEKENLAPGLSGSFSLQLAAGTYTVTCPGAAIPESSLTVTGPAGASPAAALPPELQAAVDAYAAYVKGQVAQLVVATRAFTDAVQAGDVAAAKRLYGPARAFYEQIEPVAESFGDLDPAIDIRFPDVTDPAQWTGFHRLEEALWVKGSTTGMAPIAQRLQRDVERLRDLVATETYQPAQLANGASELLDEVARSKITGEEEAYSHLDLLDFAANVEGAREAFTLLEPTLRTIDRELASTILARFGDVEAALAKQRTSDGYVAYTQLSPPVVRQLSDKVNALAEPLSQVAARIVGG